MPFMFRPAELFVGLRYVWSSQRQGLVSFMSAASLAGIALGVAALIVVLSVMNGLETEARDRLLSLSAHATLSVPVDLHEESIGEETRALTAPEIHERILQLPGVNGVSPYLNLEGMLRYDDQLYPALVRGVEPSVEQRNSGIALLITAGQWSDLDTVEDGVVIGRALAINLGVTIGDRISLLYAQMRNGQPRPGLVPLTVVGIFTAGFADHDSALALVHIDSVQAALGSGSALPSLAIRTEEPLSIIDVRNAVAVDETLNSYRYSDWTVEHRSHFRAIEIEKMMMSLILMLIVAVAAFNIVASLVMVVNDKKTDIAILRTYGLEQSKVARIFLFQGAIVGFAGVILGTALGVFMALNLERIVPWLEETFSFKIMPGDVYYVTEIPSEPHSLDIFLIALAALLVSLAATFYPSRRAAKIAPADALRYD